MEPLNLALYISLGALVVDSVIELAFISSMVSWLHTRAGGDFQIDYNNGTFPLHGKPQHLILDQGHTSNGAAGTTFVLVGISGILALWLRNKALTIQSTQRKRLAIAWYHFWLVMTIPSVLLTLGALVYTFVVNNNHNDQAIEISLAASLPNRPYPSYIAYPRLEWTPENWFVAVLGLPLSKSSDRSDIELHWRIMRGWRWNLIPMFILGLGVCGIAILEALQRRRRVAYTQPGSTHEKEEDPQ